jgi:methionine-rich copper-binding protein CopC
MAWRVTIVRCLIWRNLMTIFKLTLAVAALTAVASTAAMADSATGATNVVHTTVTTAAPATVTMTDAEAYIVRRN